MRWRKFWLRLRICIFLFSRQYVPRNTRTESVEPADPRSCRLSIKFLSPYSPPAASSYQSVSLSMWSSGARVLFRSVAAQSECCFKPELFKNRTRFLSARSGPANRISRRVSIWRCTMKKRRKRGRWKAHERITTRAIAPEVVRYFIVTG